MTTCAIPSRSRRIRKLTLLSRRRYLAEINSGNVTARKFAERTAINTPAVRALLAKKKIVPVKADWTNSNPEITAALKTFGRVGVPLYVLYPAADPANPIVLPELLTESILVEALKKLP